MAKKVGCVSVGIITALSMMIFCASIAASHRAALSGLVRDDIQLGHQLGVFISAPGPAAGLVVGRVPDVIQKLGVAAAQAFVHQVEVAGVHAFQLDRARHLLDPDVDADLLQLRLDELADRGVVQDAPTQGQGRAVFNTLDTLRLAHARAVVDPACLVQQGFGHVGVIPVHLGRAGPETGVDVVQRTVGFAVKTIVQNHVRGIHVAAIQQRLAHADVVQRRVADVHDHLKPDARLPARQHLELGVVGVILDRKRRQLIGDVGLAAAHDRAKDRLFADEAQGDGVDKGGAVVVLHLVPAAVIIPLFQRDVVVGDPLFQHEGAGADQLLVEFLRGRGLGGGRGPHRRLGGHVQEGYPGFGIGEADGVVVQRLDLVQRADVRGQQRRRGFGRQGAFEVIDDGLGIERRAVLKGHAFAQLERVDGGGVVDLPAGGKARTVRAVGHRHDQRVGHEAVEQDGRGIRVDLVIQVRGFLAGRHRDHQVGGPGGRGKRSGKDTRRKDQHRARQRGKVFDGHARLFLLVGRAIRSFGVRRAGAILAAAAALKLLDKHTSSQSSGKSAFHAATARRPSRHASMRNS